MVKKNCSENYFYTSWTLVGHGAKVACTFCPEKAGDTGAMWFPFSFVSWWYSVAVRVAPPGLLGWFHDAARDRDHLNSWYRF
jgi:hypothetical protein